MWATAFLAGAPDEVSHEPEVPPVGDDRHPARAGVVMAQTPQGFRYEVIKKAFDEASADGFLGTDEASLVERSGHDVAVVMGSPRNIKITAPGDMKLAEFYLKAERSEHH